ncbi:SAM-dependent methyltransferase [Tenacibaculum todarodis]|uniref:SAM-dependent methyltransferase n=1 Tax=Tenacibaculum todarodis TaxID=1850252 RepID=A0A1L3JG34_9FLAO|nr:class I SAM-dependent methyltransferase [Tenacibaculum todarodis]APG64101.1 SAM-dependent methyltransferase [Tenacibaculum todarodis]
MKQKKTKTPWPTKKAMEQVYQMNLWGKNNTNFYSGEGSHLPEIVNPYVDVLKMFLASLKEKITLCDFGCGDFNVGNQLVKYASKYIAVDIVKDLIQFNKEHFKQDNLEFHCLDIAKENLPAGDCAIIRQVLQHLSNAEIKSIVPKLRAFKYVVLTEHVPEGNFTPNIDIISGQGIRLKKKSGVNLLAPPFNLKVKEETQLLSFKLEQGKGVVNTVLYKMF